MATVHIIYVCLLMVVLFFHLMIIPVTPNPPPEGPWNTHLFVTHLLMLIAI